MHEVKLIQVKWNCQVEHLLNHSSVDVFCSKENWMCSYLSQIIFFSWKFFQDFKKYLCLFDL